jgi:acetylornithine deacetylase/succinyl-diaminopimelate desuccinylase-like protein
MEKPFRPGVAFGFDTPLFDAIEASVARFDPGAVVVPYMQTGGTDARALTDRDIHVYGFVPMRYEPGEEFFERCHGHDERVSVSNVQFATQVLYDIVLRLNRIE